MSAMSGLRRLALIGSYFGALGITAASAVEVPAPPGQVGIPYQIEVTSSCPGAGCEATFPVTPVNRRVDLHLANCAVQGVGNLSSISLQLQKANGDIVLIHELIEAQVIAQGGAWSAAFSANRSVFRLVPAKSLSRRFC